VLGAVVTFPTPSRPGIAHCWAKDKLKTLSASKANSARVQGGNIISNAFSPKGLDLDLIKA
jgi:hypothetical protein